MRNVSISPILISVIIPCRNEENTIKECVKAIYNSKLSKNIDIEVIVIDGGSTDNTKPILTKLQNTHTSLSIIDNPKKITPVALNLGIKNAKGDYIQIIGARHIIYPNNLANAIKTFQEKEDVWCVGARFENVYLNESSKTISMAVSSPFGVGGGNFRTAKESGYKDTVGTPIYRASVFDKIGMFNEVLVRNQDDEFNYRVRKAGGKIYLNNEVVVKYYNRASLKNLSKQYTQYGYWKVYVNNMHQTITTVRQMAPFFMVSGLIFGFILTLILPAFLPILLLGIILYVIAASYFASVISPSNFFKIAQVFPILHFSYGWGYLRGVIDFVILKRQPRNKYKGLSRK